MKLTNNRFYFDYNATSPLADSVKDFLGEDQIDFLNASSRHQSGKKSQKYINESKKYLYDFFSIPEDEYNLFFHSGATEGLNTLLLGHAKAYFLNKSSLSFFYAMTDHPACYEQVNFMKSLGHDCHEIKVDENGEIDVEYLIGEINKHSHPALLNFTYVNNLTGVVWDLDKAVRIKKETGAVIHVDAVQSIFKTLDYRKLSCELDCYTFSGHKFGSLNGIGFSFVKKSYNFEVLSYGGGQESGLRSGTSNTLAIHSLKLALLDGVEKENFTRTLEAKKYIEKSLLSHFGNDIIITGLNASTRNNNTINCIFKTIKVDQLLTAFDMAGIEVSSGPACSGGLSIAVNPGLRALGYSKHFSSASIRFSFSPFMQMNDAKAYYKSISEVICKFIH